MEFPPDDAEFDPFWFTEDFYETAPEARTDANTTIMSLPIELLLEITRYSKFSDIYSLTTVNKILHAVAIERFYSVVAIKPKHFLSRVESSPGISKDSDIVDMLPLFDCKFSSILRGLFAHKRHLCALRKLVICNFPGTYKETETALLCTIVHEIVNDATGLGTLRIANTDWSSTRGTTGIDLTGVTCPPTLRVVNIPVLREEASQAILRHIGSLTELTVESVTHEFLESCSDNTYSRVTLFSSDWDIHSAPERHSESTKIGHHLPRIMPNIQSLTLRFTPPWYQQSEYEALAERFNETCDLLLRNLKKLRHFTVQKVSELTYDTVGSIHINDEVAMLKRFASLRPSLESVTIYKHNPFLLFGSDYYYEKSVTWKKVAYPSNPNAAGRGLRDVVWTPDPRVISRWWWWFGMYGHVTDVRAKMVEHWKGESDIPSLDRLKLWAEDEANTIKYHLQIV
ncbi:hypothetical protein M408DRAFT_195816 [Serendipita vermifera MAFF 305830]|uniref:F-box domain-containing protein n=1 Tax=Serendipita vermifera MAFF 305830 TaxID=933852 RepID=A0A0C3AP41_SERVB|nr:hypothetical protein M408DRAFT_195816 [Serendipita vermifera MAFF 305830]